MANINIRIDESIKANAEKVFSKLGLTPTTAIILFYNQVIRTNSIPFELKVDTPNKETLEAISEVKEMEKNPDQYKGFDNINDFMEDLLK